MSAMQSIYSSELRYILRKLAETCCSEDKRKALLQEGLFTLAKIEKIDRPLPTCSPVIEQQVEKLRLQLVTANRNLRAANSRLRSVAVHLSTSEQQNRRYRKEISRLRTTVEHLKENKSTNKNAIAQKENLILRYQLEQAKEKLMQLPTEEMIKKSTLFDW